MTTSKVKDTEHAANDNRNNVDTSITKLLNSELMKQVISSNALESFNKICNVKTPAMIKKLEGTARDILIEGKWITNYIQAVATDAVAYQKNDVQRLMERHINLKPTQNLINCMAKEACNK